MAQGTHSRGELGTQRRSLGGARREATERVELDVDGRLVHGWTLNVSRGGMRVVIDESLEVAREVTARLGDEAPRPARVVWARDEGGGQILGLEFLRPRSESPAP